MELLIVACIVIVFLAIALEIRSWIEKSKKAQASQEKTKPEYKYSKKEYIMTAAEGTFYRRLDGLFGDRYFIFPQVHLSSLLEHRVKGQDWKAALSKIQRKSVDFALVDKQSLRTIFAVELDDLSHDSQKRIVRDDFVDGAFRDSGVRLVRIRGVDSMRDAQILEKFQH